MTNFMVKSGNIRLRTDFRKANLVQP